MLQATLLLYFGMPGPLELAILGLLFGFFAGVMLLAPFIIYLLTLQRALAQCHQNRQAMTPGMVYLLFIPLFGAIWHFFVVDAVGTSLQAESAARGRPLPQKPGHAIGITTCVLMVCGIIPGLGILCVFAGLICWIIYWVQIAQAARELATLPPVAPPFMA